MEGRTGPNRAQRFSSPAILINDHPRNPRFQPIFIPERRLAIKEDEEFELDPYESFYNIDTYRSNRSRRTSHSRWRRSSTLLSLSQQPGKTARKSYLSTASNASYFSTFASKMYRPLSFNGSIWVKDPDDIVLKFEIGEDPDEKLQSFDPSNHSWSRSKKKRFVYLVSLAAMFSPLSSNIYFPALNAISAALNTSIGLISLSITVYMLVQGIAPSFWGPLADSYGRRPIFLATLMVYVIANAVLSLPGGYAVLMFFRGLQAAGSASTIAIGAGVIGDIADADERGGFMGLFGGIRMFGQAVGPVFGGALSQYLGFRSIFFFLTGLSAAVIILLITYLPETQRKIAGDGTRRLYGIYRPLLGAPKGPEIPPEERYKPSKMSFAILLESFKLLAEKDVAISLLFGGVIYTVWSMITSSTASLFKEEYHLNEVLIGLAFLPNGKITCPCLGLKLTIANQAWDAFSAL
ncbi:uncharacterized protein PV09_08530 [Verruconis gallopava]|uniref:Major facilitator superfamily (MFS) profile domain-containing protein n=1 Tax=Verruconis gallopava TaxID=253628 RepID=A0A0D1ZZK1_9PEZI|nr:uncharacterized protein PV09_08530 [Verruconis gallopava]KIV99862.1 hypothetical protein PV09_08530 [Verruconis gallopava]